MSKDFHDGGVFVWSRAVLMRKAFWQNQIDEEGVCNGKSGRKKNGAL